MEEWGSRDKRVAETFCGFVRVSTVFLGIDHNFLGIGDPILFETMLFPLSENIMEYQDRYSTWDEAVVGHRKATFWALNPHRQWLAMKDFSWQVLISNLGLKLKWKWRKIRRRFRA
jgi:hypothetical protein